MKRPPWLHIRPLSLERRTEVFEQLAEASSPGFDFLLLIVLSCCIATFGLITDSAAVIIGAMLVAPLMSPLLGLSLASVAGRRHMFQHAAIALVEGAALAVLLSALLSKMAVVLPFGALRELSGEVLARAHPNPFDLGVALAGGAAASYALAQPKISAALPGVAIATALMPPLCTVGIGIAVGDVEVALGALLLFLTNFAAIAFAGIVVFALLGFRPLFMEVTWHGLPRGVVVSAVLVLLITVPLAFFSLQFVSEARLTRQVLEAVQSELEILPQVQLVNVNVARVGNGLRLLVTVRASASPSYGQVVALQAGIAARLQRPTALQLIVVPTTILDPLVPPSRTPTPTPGPSSTSTATAAATSTSIPMATITPAPTSTPTLAPIVAVVSTGTDKGVALRDGPAGAISGFLPEGALVQLLYRRESVAGVEWVEVRDAIGRVGWLPTRVLVVRP